MTDTPDDTDNRTARIATALRRAIVEQALKPGTKLPEDQIAERFGTGRTLARQALGQLASEGLVELRRNKGAQVAEPSWEDARDIFDVRISIERIVVTRLAGKLTPAQLAELEDLLAQEKAASGSDALAIRLATEFHVRLAEMTERPALIRYVREICYRCALTLSMFARPHSSECAISEHRTLLDALSSGDAITAAGLMEEHLEAVATRALVQGGARVDGSLMELLAPYAEG